MYEPAWIGTAPAAPDFAHAVAANKRAEIEAILNRHYFADDRAHVLGALREGRDRPDLCGHYKVAAASGEYVARLRPERSLRDLQLAAAIAVHAARAGVCVATFRPDARGRIEIWEHECAVTVATYRTARHASAAPQDCAALGHLLAELHNALATFSRAPDVEAAWKARAAELTAAQQECRTRLPSGVPASLRQLVARAAERYDADFSVLGGKRQCVHGDVTPGNVLFTGDGHALLCDFEDAAEAFWPHGFDVCSAVLRFAHAPDAEGRGERQAALIDAYNGQSVEVLESQSIARGIENLLDHNLMVMADAALKGLAVPGSEWTKFARLAAVADAP